MLDIALNISKYSIPTTLTSALHVAPITGPNQIPREYHALPYFVARPWEEQYLPKTLIDDHGKLERIYQFAVNWLQESEDIPDEFAKILNEDFWEIV